MSTATLIDHASTVSKLYNAFSRGDLDFILDHIADDCEWIGAGEGSLTQGGTYIGREAAKFFKSLLENEEFKSFNPTSVNNINDDEVVAFGDMVVISKATRKEVRCDWVMHWKFNDEGKAVYFHDFFDTAAAYLAEQGDLRPSQEQQNINIVKEAFDNFLKGNIAAIIDSCADDIKWGAHENPGVPYAKNYYGKKGAEEFFSTLGATVNYTAFEPQEFYSDGRKVFVKGHHQATVKSTGKTFGHDMLLEFTLKGAKLDSFFAYVDTRDQAEAFTS